MGTLTLSREHQSVWMSKITNDGLTLSGIRCFIAVPIWQQWASKDFKVVFCAHRECPRVDAAADWSEWRGPDWCEHCSVLIRSSSGINTASKQRQWQQLSCTGWVFMEVVWYWFHHESNWRTLGQLLLFYF